MRRRRTKLRDVHEGLKDSLFHFWGLKRKPRTPEHCAKISEGKKNIYRAGLTLY